MNNKVALIIGGSGGIGIAATKRLFHDGMQVCSTYYRNKESIDSIQSELGKESVSSYRCDIRKESEVNTTIEKVLEKHKKVDVVIFAVASQLKHQRLLDIEWTDVYEHIELQLKAMLIVMKSLREQIRSKHKMKFIVVSTEFCMGAPPKGLAHYVTAKYGAIGLSKAMAVELVQYGCTVNMVSPGMVDTSLLKDVPPKLIEMTAHQNPMKRIARPEDIANVISFLASDKADYLNGINIPVNGGGVMQ